jgi:arsenite methyltransferase
MDIESAVRERYSQGAKAAQPALCYPVSYDRRLLDLLPQEIVEKDYGCGDPSRYVQAGDVVLDLGSGAGKICYMAAQLVGDSGRVLGVDMNDDMLAVARKYQQEMAGRLGGDRVRFLKGYIQDLALDVEATDRYLREHPVTSEADLGRLRSFQAEQRRERPLIADASVDLVVSNCVLNLVADDEKRQLVQELFRVLKPGGRVAISDVVSDKPVPDALKADPELWSGCISGAFQERAFLDAFAAAGFLAVRYDQWAAQPWQVVQGIEFRSVTLVAVKGEGPADTERGHVVIYRGPFASVTDDQGQVFPRGERIAVCERTFRFLTEGPYRDHFIGVSAEASREPAPCCGPETGRASADGSSCCR